MKTSRKYRRRWVRILTACLLAMITLTGCRSNESPASGQPRHIESATCRTDGSRLLDIAGASHVPDSTLTFETFRQRFDELSDQADDALLACSTKVAQPFREAMYHYALLTAEWHRCGQGGGCDTAMIASEGKQAGELLERARQALAARR